MIERISQFLWPKKIRYPWLRVPAYIERHPGRVFLVLGSGPTIRTHTEAISRFVAHHSPVILSANIPHPLWAEGVQYVAFTNRKRLGQAATFPSLTDMPCLIGPHIRSGQAWMPRWERLPYLNAEQPFAIVDGIIQCDCGDCGTTLIAVAFIMGASEIYVAGMDGYRADSAAHYYVQPDWKPAVALDHQRRVRKVLPQMRQVFAAAGVSGPTWLTPSVYQEESHV